MSSRRFYRRTFLNLRGHHAGAYVLADLSVEKHRSKEKTERWINADLRISDCGDVVVLDFDASDATSARNAIHKARLLSATLNQFTTALESAVAELELR